MTIPDLHERYEGSGNEIPGVVPHKCGGVLVLSTKY